MEKLSLHWGLKKIILGALLLLNAFVWPKWLGIDGWIQFLAVLIIICGVIRLFHSVPPYHTIPTLAATQKVTKKRKK